MNPVDVPALSSLISQFAEARDWDQFHSVKNLTTALSVETAELAEIFQWLTEEQSNKATLDPAKREKIEDELADVTIYLLRLFEKTGIEIEPAVRNKMRKNADKYPIELAKGNAEKYSSRK